MEQILVDYFKNQGYLDVRVKNWKGVRLYVTLTEDLSFNYDITQDYKVRCDKWMSKKDYKIAYKGGRRLQEVIKARGGEFR